MAGLGSNHCRIRMSGEANGLSRSEAETGGAKKAFAIAVSAFSFHLRAPVADESGTAVEWIGRNAAGKRPLLQPESSSPGAQPLRDAYARKGIGSRWESDAFAENSLRADYLE